MELIREIIVPTSNSYLLNLPDNLIGKQVEVIAFEIENPVSTTNDKVNGDQKMQDIQEIFKNSLVDLSNFRFDRNEANNYN